MADDNTNLREGCHRVTTTVHGKCANSWHVKNPSAVPRRRRYKPTLWDDDDLISWAWEWFSWAPGAVAALLGLLLDVPALLFIGGGLLALRLVGTHL